MGGLLNQRKDQKGFTLIEIVLVLAIAGFIFVIVFMAVQGANRGKADTDLKSAMGRVLGGAEQYASNNNGAYPANCGAFIPAYANIGSFSCTSHTGAQSAAVGDGTIQYITGARCSGQNTVSASSRFIATRGRLATAPENFCQGNN